MRVLFVTMDGGGNLPPLLGIAREVQRRGGTARGLGNRTQRAAIESAGLEFIGMTAGREYDAKAPRSTIGGIRDLSALFADRGIGRDAIAAENAEHVDVVVVDCLLWGAALEIAKSGLPVVSLVHSQWKFFRSNARGPLGMLARLRGSNPVLAESVVLETLVTTRLEFEGDAGDAERPGGHHLGFVWQDAPVASAPDLTRPRVLVSFSTTSFPGQARALQAVIDALDGLPLDVIVTTGAVDPSELRTPAGMRVERSADHGAILQSTALVIGHGGHATTARALTHGIPVLVLPMHPLMDQPAIGRAVERLGVGGTMSKTSSTQHIREKVLALLADESVRSAAHAMGASARKKDGAIVGADLLELRFAPAQT